MKSFYECVEKNKFGLVQDGQSGRGGEKPGGNPTEKKKNKEKEREKRDYRMEGTREGGVI